MRRLLISSLNGLIVIVPLSLGNHQFVKSLKFQLIAVAFLAVFTSVLFIEFILREFFGVENTDAGWEQLRSFPGFRALVTVFAGLSVLIFLELLRGICATLLPKGVILRFLALRWLFLPSNVRRSMWTKRSGTHKVNRLVHNAYRLHQRTYIHLKKEKIVRKGDIANQLTMLNFVAHGEKVENCGGLWWTWKRVLHTKELIQKEGIWIHSRLVVGQASQLILLAVLGVTWWFGMQAAADSARSARQDIEDDDSTGSEWARWAIPTEDTYVTSRLRHA